MLQAEIAEAMALPRLEDGFDDDFPPMPGSDFNPADPYALNPKH